MRTIAYYLWKLGLIKSCPLCGKELVEVGHPKDFVQYYKCTNPQCDFGKVKEEEKMD